MSTADLPRFLVAVRTRPLPKELESVVEVDTDEQISVVDPGHTADNVMRQQRLRDRRYAFDFAFSGAAGNEQIYDRAVRHMLSCVLEGFNACVFAYGQTGSGKTHSMAGTPADPGIMVRSLRDLYAGITSTGNKAIVVSLYLSYVEVYNETIRDLLATGPTAGAALELREDPLRGPCVAGGTEHAPVGVDHVLRLIDQGNKRRTQESTAANATSSRSHAVLQVVVEQRPVTGGGKQDIRVSKLSLIDLAGSERASHTQNRGIRLLEGANINRSLLSLGNCIDALLRGKGRSYVPYRDSKLTRLLKDSLGRTSTRTLMLGCVSPAASAFEETTSTLKWVDRAKGLRAVMPALKPNAAAAAGGHAGRPLSGPFDGPSGAHSFAAVRDEYERMIASLGQEVTSLKQQLQTATVALRPSGRAPVGPELAAAAVLQLLPASPHPFAEAFGAGAV